MEWIGSTLLALCAVPQVLHCIRYKNADGVDWLFILMWLFGEIILLIYMLPKNEYALISNYILNIICLGIIIYYKINPRRSYEDRD